MKCSVIQVKEKPIDRPALIPELMASFGARYSRSKDGMDVILDSIGDDQEAAIDRIFDHLDYGHASILDMVPIAIAVEQITLHAAMLIFNICQIQAGQESSTRYIKFDLSGCLHPDYVDSPKYEEHLKRSFTAYESASKYWSQQLDRTPELARIPKHLLESPDPKDQKAVKRMLRNAVLDRSRYFLPMAALTNMFLIQSAREWCMLIRELLSHPLRELNELGMMIKSEIEVIAPRSAKYARPSKASLESYKNEFRVDGTFNVSDQERIDTEAFFFDTGWTDYEDLAQDLQHRNNRYDTVGTQRFEPVSFGWNFAAFAEIRDLNRHRTGARKIGQIPNGFYCASEEAPDAAHILALKESVLSNSLPIMTSMVNDHNHSWVYFANLGTTVTFEHNTTMGPFVYECELRTGLGAHYRYRAMIKDVLTLMEDGHPGIRQYILEGEGEPE